jgi:hypothetical protein
MKSWQCPFLVRPRLSWFLSQVGQHQTTDGVLSQPLQAFSFASFRCVCFVPPVTPYRPGRSLARHSFLIYSLTLTLYS